MECPNCHIDNLEGARFCASCGTSLTSESGPVAASVGLAGRGTRLGAVVIDALIYGVPMILMAILAPVLARGGDIGPIFFFLIGLSIIGIFLYQLMLLSRDGQTLGKKAVGIRIVKKDTGENGGFVSNVLLRIIVNGLLGIIPLYGLVDILFIFREDRRCIHDMIAGTVVVRAQATIRPDPF